MSGLVTFLLFGRKHHQGVKHATVIRTQFIRGITWHNMGFIVLKDNTHQLFGDNLLSTLSMKEDLSSWRVGVSSHMYFV